MKQNKFIALLVTVMLLCGVAAGMLLPAGAAAAEVSAYDGSVDVSWYSEGKTEYIIKSAAALAGLAKIVNDGTSSFEGATVYLDCDVVWNEGSALDWDKTAPKYTWTPIGVTGSGNTNTGWRKDKVFRGSFDGQGHIVSGLYFSDTVDWVGFFSLFGGPYLGNLSIINSYFSAKARIGSFAGLVYGPVSKDANAGTDDYADDLKSGNCNLYENLYTDAIIVSSEASNSRSGGIFGICRQDDVSGSDSLFFGSLSVMKNCWSNATVSIPEGGKYIGGMTANITGSSVSVASLGYGDMVFINCLTTAAITCNGAGAGGFCTEIYRTDAHFINCVSMLTYASVVDASAGAFAGLTTFKDGYGGRIFTEGGFVIYPEGLTQLISSATSGSDNYTSVKTVKSASEITGLDSKVFAVSSTVSLKTVRTALADSYDAWLADTGYVKPSQPETPVTTAPVVTTETPAVTTAKPAEETTPKTGEPTQAPDETTAKPAETTAKPADTTAASGEKSGCGSVLGFGIIVCLIPAAVIAVKKKD